MGYCRFCGKEIEFKRTKNEKWLPCDAYTGEPHFCQNDKKVTGKKKQINNSGGITPCKICGKPTFAKIINKKKIFYDYSTLEIHSCKKRDITIFNKYKNTR